MINTFLYFSDNNKNKDIQDETADIKVTDILEGGREISKDWLEKEATKRLKTHNKSLEGEKDKKHDSLDPTR